MNSFLKKCVIRQGLFTASLVCLLVLGSKTVTAQKADFSGNWKLNSDKSDFGNLSPNSAAVVMKISQQGDSIAIDKTFNRKDENTVSIKDILPLNGNIVESVTQDIKKTTSATWSADHQQLKLSSGITGSPDDYTTTQEWSLSPDGSILYISRTDDGVHGNFKLNLVYNKQ